MQNEETENRGKDKSEESVDRERQQKEEVEKTHLKKEIQMMKKIQDEEAEEEEMEQTN